MGKDSRRYGLADFRRYHENKMMPEEQYSFEKRMLEDPFLREAFEGFEILRKDGIAADSISEKLNGLLPGVGVSRPEVVKRPVWKYMAVAAVLLVAVFFSYLRFGEKRDSVQLKEVSEIKSTGTIEEHSGQLTGTEVKDTAVVLTPPAMVAKPRGTLPDTTGTSPSRRAVAKKELGGEADTWQLPRGTAQLASADFHKGEVIVVDARDIPDLPDSAAPGDVFVVVEEKSPGDTTKYRKESQSVTRQMSFEEYLKRSTQNALKYGESVQFKILRNGRLEDFTPEEQDSLLKEVLKRERVKK